MFISEPKTFHDAIKPIVYFNCILGLGVLRQPNQSGTVYFLMNLHMFVITFMTWTMIYITVTSISQVINFDDASPMVLLMYKALICANSSTVLIAPVLIWFQKKGIRDCLQQMPILDDTFQAIFGAQKKYRREYIRMSCQVISIVLVTFLVGVCTTVFSLEIELQMNARSVLKFSSISQTLLQPILVMLLLDVNFCIFLRYLENKFRDLNESLLRLIAKPFNFQSCQRQTITSTNFINVRPRNEVANAEDLINDKKWLIQESRKAHLELCKLSRKINVIFGTQNLISIAVSFALITGLLYAIYSTVTGKNFDSRKLKELVPSAIWTAIYAFKIWNVNHSCSSVSNEADRTGEVIHELLNSRVDKKLDEEISGFSVQIIKNPIRFNACGFFTLDYAFIQSVIGSITTYLVILIQMSSAVECNSANSHLECFPAACLVSETPAWGDLKKSPCMLVMCGFLALFDHSDE